MVSIDFTHPHSFALGWMSCVMSGWAVCWRVGACDRGGGASGRRQYQSSRRCFMPDPRSPPLYLPCGSSFFVCDGLVCDGRNVTRIRRVFGCAFVSWTQAFSGRGQGVGTSLSPVFWPCRKRREPRSLASSVQGTLPLVARPLGHTSIRMSFCQQSSGRRRICRVFSSSSG